MKFTHEQSSWEGSNKYLGRRFNVQTICSQCKEIEVTMKFKLANNCNLSYKNGKFVPLKHIYNWKYLYYGKWDSNMSIDGVNCKYCDKIKKLKE